MILKENDIYCERNRFRSVPSIFLPHPSYSVLRIRIDTASQCVIGEFISDRASLSMIIAFWSFPSV